MRTEERPPIGRLDHLAQGAVRRCLDRLDNHPGSCDPLDDDLADEKALLEDVAVLIAHIKHLEDLRPS